jgi:predicted membrane protein
MWWFFIIHLLAIVIASTAYIDLAVKVVVVVCILISLFFYVNRERHLKSFTLRYSTELCWEIAHSNNDFKFITIAPSTVLSSHLIFLHYHLIEGNEVDKRQSKLTTQLICKDALAVDKFRQLKVELKISGLQTIEDQLHN